jgi:HEAT repeat protein
VTLLGLSSDDASRDVLMSALEADDPTVRAAAIGALGERAVRGAADRVAMFATADSQPMAVRLAAIRALRQFGTSTHVAEMAELATDRPPPPPEEPEEDDAEAEEAPPEDAADEAGTDETSDEAETAGEEAAEIGETDEAAEEAEAPAEEEAEEWSDDTLELRIEAVRTIAVLGAANGEEAGGNVTATAIEVLAEACSQLEHSDEVRQAACYAWVDLAQMEMSEEVNTDAVEALVGAADDEVGDVRVAAVHGLSTLEPPEALRDDVQRVMEDALDDDHYWVRVAAGEEPIGG